MKKYKHKLLTLLSVLAIGASAVGFACTDSLKANASEDTYSPISVFSYPELTEYEAKTVNGTSYTAMKLSNEGKVSYRQDLAFRWFTGSEQEKFFEMELSFADKNFNEFSVTFESATDHKTKEDKAVNVLTFVNANGKLSAKVNDGNTTEVSSDNVKISFYKTSEMESGVYQVSVNGTVIGDFENIGGYFSEFSSSSITPLTFSAKLDGDKTTSVAILSLNGQSFALNENGKIVDNAAPVLVVNQPLKSFNLGRNFSLSYEAIDVLDTTVSKSLDYYMYSPEDKEVKYTSLFTSFYFFEKAGVEDNCVSIRAKLSDNDSSHTTTYEIAWYADKDMVKVYDSVEYIPLVRDEAAPYYTCIKESVDENGKKINVLDTENAAYIAYQKAVEKAGENLAAGSGNNFYLPSLRDLIVDGETAYETIKFNIFYKTAYTSADSSNLDLTSANLSFPTSTVGYYKFRVVPTDDADNTMQLYKDGRLVTVSASNVWDFDCIPEFGFTAHNNGVAIDDAVKKASAYVGQTYTLPSFTIKAISGYSTAYTLYYFEGALNDSSISYDSLIKMANSSKTAAEPYGEFASYIKATSGLHFRKIDVYNSSISDDDAAWDSSDNAYAWYGSGSSFVPQESGFYVLMIEVIDSELWGDKVVGYQVVEVAAEKDIIKGESHWLEENYVSVIFFSLAGVALIAIVVLLVVKPKEENIDEIDLDKINKKAKKKAE